MNSFQKALPWVVATLAVAFVGRMAIPLLPKAKTGWTTER